MEKLRDLDLKIVVPVTAIIVIAALFFVMRSAGVGVEEAPPSVPPIATEKVDLSKMGATGDKKQAGSGPAMLK